MWPHNRCRHSGHSRNGPVRWTSHLPPICMRQSLLATSLLALVSSTAFAQGTPGEYMRADSLPARVRGKIINQVNATNWVGKTSYVWYRKSTGTGNAYVMVNAETGEKLPAFDHARLAQSLSLTLKRPVNADSLPLAALMFSDDRATMTFNADSGRIRCVLADYRCTEYTAGWPWRVWARLRRRLPRRGSCRQHTAASVARQPVAGHRSQLQHLCEARRRKGRGCVAQHRRQRRELLRAALHPVVARLEAHCGVSRASGLSPGSALCGVVAGGSAPAEVFLTVVQQTG